MRTNLHDRTMDWRSNLSNAFQELTTTINSSTHLRDNDQPQNNPTYYSSSHSNSYIINLNEHNNFDEDIRSRVLYPPPPPQPAEAAHLRNDQHYRTLPPPPPEMHLPTPPLPHPMHPAAAAAEDIRTADIMAQHPGMPAALEYLVRYVPFICIILAKTSYDLLDSVLDILALVITFMHANMVVRQQVALQTHRSIFKLLRELVYIILVIAVVGFMLEKDNIFIGLIFAHSSSEESPFTLRHMLFSIGVTDFVLKLVTVGVKIVITLMPPSIIEYKGRVSF